MCMGSNQRLQKIDIGATPAMSSTIRTVDTARDLGVVNDSGLSMTDEVSTICRAAYYQLRQLHTVTRCLTTEATNKQFSLLSSRLL